MVIPMMRLILPLAIEPIGGWVCDAWPKGSHTYSVTEHLHPLVSTILYCLVTALGTRMNDSPTVIKWQQMSGSQTHKLLTPTQCHYLRMQSLLQFSFWLYRCIACQNIIFIGWYQWPKLPGLTHGITAVLNFVTVVAGIDAIEPFSQFTLCHLAAAPSILVKYSKITNMQLFLDWAVL